MREIYDGLLSGAEDNMVIPRLRLLIVILVALHGRFVHADYLVQSQAMFASTIAEYYVEEGRIRLELEIGVGDLAGFRNLMPDEIYERLEYPPRPFEQRLADFYTRDLVIRAGDGDPLIGRIVEMGPRSRGRRDPISGEPLPVADEDPETVVYAVIEYVLDGRPDTLSLYGPSMEPKPGIGYVAYHRNIAVNDFRYLTPIQTLELDWDDPWYSAFRRRSLRRAYFAPMSGFIYVEPYEVRKEIILRPKDLQDWVDLGLDGRDTIPVAMQPGLMQTAAEFLRGRHKVVIDGREVVPELARINFLERSLRASRVIEPPRELDVYSAILGVIFVYPTEGLPENVTMDWDLFNERIRVVPTSAVDQAGPFPVLLEPELPALEWKNFLKNPVLPTLVEIRRPPSSAARLLGATRWLLLSGGIVLAVWLLLRNRRGAIGLAASASGAAAAVLVGGIAFWIGGGAGVSDEKAKEVVAGLLHNIYRAFDYRQEERIYDTLDRSVSGDLLERIYLETRKGLELANQGGARAKVKEIELLEIASRPGEGGAVTATTTWNVHGSVGHWGHVHRRSNRYQAELNIAPVDGVWKLTALEILDEQRL